MIEVSVVIPTYNRLDALSQVLPTLLAQDLPPEQYELLVCDSNSSDGTAEYVSEMESRHRSVRRLAGAYSGRAAARNAGIAAARGTVVLFNDADILASPNLISSHLRRHRERTGIAHACRKLRSCPRRFDGLNDRQRSYLQRARSARLSRSEK